MKDNLSLHAYIKTCSLIQLTVETENQSLMSINYIKIKNTLEHCFNELEFSNMTIPHVLKIKIIKATARFELMAYRVLVVDKTLNNGLHC